jgi:hypothetical protein
LAVAGGHVAFTSQREVSLRVTFSVFENQVNDDPTRLPAA